MPRNLDSIPRSIGGMSAALWSALFGLSFCLAAIAQPASAPVSTPSVDTNAVPPVISTNATDLVDLATFIPDVILDIRYATTNNFTGKVLYPSARCCLRREAAENLKAVQGELRSQGLGLKIYDGYRPWSVQKKMWAIFPHPDYVADPAKGSRHNRGAAVDLTLVDAHGNELPMPTAFDAFTERAHRDYTNLPPEIIANRALLESTMKRHHFKGLPTEWWHFDLVTTNACPLLDVDFAVIQ